MITFFDETGSEISLYRAEKYFSRLLGLFSSKASRLNGIVLSPCNSIHTLFFFKSIDVVFLSKEKKILKVVKNIASFRVCRCPSAYYVIEIFCNSYQYPFIVGEYFDL